MEKKFASQADLAEKKISFVQLGEGAYAYTAEGDPNTGIVIGDDGVMVIDTQATPVMAQDVIRRIREVTDKPIKYVVMSHYHAVRVLGASAYRPEHIIASQDTYELIVERGEADMKSEIERFPRLFRSVESIPGPDLADAGVQGRADAVDGQARSEDPAARPRPHQRRHGGLAAEGKDPVQRRPGGVRRDALRRRRVPARLAEDAGPAPRARAREAGAGPRRRAGHAGPGRGRPERHTGFHHADVRVGAGRGAGRQTAARTSTRTPTPSCKPKFGHWVIFDHCMPFDVSRAYDEATQYPDPRIWTAQRDKEMWAALEG